jgi:hypothetical protein
MAGAMDEVGKIMGAQVTKMRQTQFDNKVGPATGCSARHRMPLSFLLLFNPRQIQKFWHVAKLAWPGCKFEMHVDGGVGTVCLSSVSMTWRAASALVDAAAGPSSKANHGGRFASVLTLRR